MRYSTIDFDVTYDPKRDALRMEVFGVARDLIDAGRLPIIIRGFDGLTISGPVVAEQGPKFVRAVYSEEPEAALAAIVKATAEFVR